tara:strand:- start:44087 stop:44617 length:531 start_codon:yes stop_codon:yes gene_type:complete
MVVIDNNILGYLIAPNSTPMDETTGKPLKHARERLDHLVKTLQEEKKKIAIPAPVLAELLVVNRKKSDELLTIINDMGVFRPLSFDQRAAIELALHLESEKETRKLSPGTNDTKAKVRFDRQIVAIAKSQNVKTIYSDDKGVKALGSRLGITVIGLKDMELPQKTIPLFAEVETEE